MSSDKDNKDFKRLCTGYHCMVSEDNISDFLTSDENPIDKPSSLDRCNNWSFPYNALKI